MPEWSAPDRSRSRAVLMGTSEYKELPAIPAAANSLDRMRRLLTGPLCAWPARQVTVLRNRRVPANLADRLVQFYAAATDVALFYYVGHGQIDDYEKLCLGLVGSRLQTERRATTSLTFDAVRAALLRSRARVKIVILDSCFAGQAVHGPHTLAGHAADVSALIGGTGAYTLAATGPYTTAWFEDDRDNPSPQTYFTKHLIDLVEQGIPGEPTGLTLDPIYRQLREDLPAAGRPVPTRLTRDFGDTFVFARNVAPRLTDPQMSEIDHRTRTPPEIVFFAARLARTLRDHWVLALAFSPPDGRWLASGRDDGAVALWDSVTGELKRSLIGDAGWVWALAFSPDGRLLASASAKGPDLWDPATSEHRTLSGHTGFVKAVAFSPDGQLLASAGDDKTVRLWNPATGAQQRTLTGHTDLVRALAFSPGGRLLASAGNDRTVRLWNPATGGHPRSLTGHAARVTAVAFSPGGRWLASGSSDSTVRLWELYWSTGELGDDEPADELGENDRWTPPNKASKGFFEQLRQRLNLD